MKGKGANLNDIVPPLTLPVVVQLVNSDNGLCFQGDFLNAGEAAVEVIVEDGSGH